MAMDKRKLKEQADKLLQRARRILVSKTQGPNEREHKYCDTMQLYCTYMAEIEPQSKWHTHAQEWSKRKQVASKQLSEDKLDMIWERLESFREAGDQLSELN